MIETAASRVAGTDTGGAAAAAMALPAVASFLLNRGARAVLMGLARRRAPPSPAWRTLSEGLRQPGALPYVMVTGPRWNTHAAVAGFGPVRVAATLSVDLACAARSARMWTLVIYDAGTMRTVAALDGARCGSEGRGPALRLPAGRYAAILRYYHPGPAAMLPAVAIDGAPAIAARALPDEFGHLEGLRGRTGPLYLGLQYYAYALVRCHRFLPEALVRRHFLPVGNPETQFVYGALRRGECLSVDLSGAGAEGSGVYVSFYNRASFPLSWAELRGPRYTSEAMPAPGTYLLRIHRATGAAGTVDLDRVAIAVRPAPPGRIRSPRGPGPP